MKTKKKLTIFYIVIILLITFAWWVTIVPEKFDYPHYVVRIDKAFFGNLNGINYYQQSEEKRLKGLI